MTFGEKLKQIRIDLGLSQQAFADILKTSKQVISRYELGQTTPKISVAANWCKILGIDLNNMLNDEKGVYDTFKYRLHHVEDGQTLQLIERKIHEQFTHKGGMSVKKRGGAK